jgi:CheY-like chemotaxis protein
MPISSENALLNLCINSRDAMPNGGRITIETANKWIDERTAGERNLEPGQYITICVSEQVEPVHVVAPEPARASATVVLVIDDEPTVRMLITDALNDLNYTCIEAVDGPNGLEVLQSDKRVDLLITDVGLPGGLNGRQVADAALELRPKLKVLFITGYAENAALNHGHIGPGMAVLTKPFAISELARRVERMLGRS